MAATLMDRSRIRPGLVLRSNEPFDIAGVDPGQEFGDDPFRGR